MKFIGDLAFHQCDISRKWETWASVHDGATFSKLNTAEGPSRTVLLLTVDYISDMLNSGAPVYLIKVMLDYPDVPLVSYIRDVFLWNHWEPDLCNKLSPTNDSQQLGIVPIPPQTSQKYNTGNLIEIAVAILNQLFRILKFGRRNGHEFWLCPLTICMSNSR